MRVAVAEDSLLLRQLLMDKLASMGIEVVAESSTGENLLQEIAAAPPDVAIIDIRMANDDDGLDVAELLRSRHPDVGILILSQYCDTAYAVRTAALGDRGVGYLTKDNVDISTLRRALERIEAGESYFDPVIVRRLLDRQRAVKALDNLSETELDTLRLAAEGRSNQGIGREVHRSPRTIEKSLSEIYRKLELDCIEDKQNHNLRVLATLKWLQAAR
jgi:DNA-binding NarL/FixJ family response regulator